MTPVPGEPLGTMIARLDGSGFSHSAVALDGGRAAAGGGPRSQPVTGVAAGAPLPRGPVTPRMLLDAAWTADHVQLVRGPGAPPPPA